MAHLSDGPPAEQQQAAAQGAAVPVDAVRQRAALGACLAQQGDVAAHPRLLQEDDVCGAGGAALAEGGKE